MNYPGDAIIVQKTPAGEFDISVNWGCPSRDLGDDMIVASVWTLTGPDSSLQLTDGAISDDKKITTIWLSGGTLGSYYSVTNTITSSDDRVLQGTFTVQIVQFLFLTQPRLV